MGYQESLLTSNDFDGLCTRIRDLGPEYFDDNWISFGNSIITFKRDLTARIKPPKIYPAGTRFLYVIGDRHWQRGNDDKIGIDYDLIFAEGFANIDEFFKLPDGAFENDFVLHSEWEWAGTSIPHGWEDG